MNNWFKNISESMQWKWIGWLGAGMVIFGYYLNANEYIASWLVWMVGNIMVGIYSLYKKAYSTAAMSFMITMMNIYGYIRWLT
jgi:nicotinamide riboside transporter PnuC